MPDLENGVADLAKASPDGKTETDGLLHEAGAEAEKSPSLELNWSSCSTEEFKDWPYAVLFLLNLAFLLCLLMVNYDESYFDLNSAATAQMYCNSDGVCGNTIVGESSYSAVFMAIGSGIVLSLVWLIALQWLPTLMVQVGMVFGVALPGLMCVAALFSGHFFAFGILLLFTAGCACWWSMVQSRIALAAKMLEVSAKFLAGHLSLLGVAFGSLIVTVVFMLIWASAFYCTLMSMGAIAEDGTQTASAKHSGLGVMVYFFLTYFWAINVFANTLHVIAAGAFAEYWIMGEFSDEDKVYRSMKRALRGSFGSICFGSLLISFVQALRSLVQQSRSAEGDETGMVYFMQCCADCFLFCIAEVMDFITTYAFVHVAVYGDDFCSSGAKTWDLISASGFDMIVNQDLTQMALTASAFGGSILGGGATYVLAKESSGIHDSTAYQLALIGAVITFGCMMLIMSLATSCVAAIYVLFAEKPAEGMLHHPEDVQDLIDAWKEAYEDLTWTRNGDAYVIERIKPPPEYSTEESSP